MTREPLIKINDLDLSFPLSFDRLGTAQSKVTVAFRRWSRGEFARRRIRVFQALKNIQLKANHGDVIGVIGPNGSGKTTLLRIIAGIYAPDRGEVEVAGRISTLLSLGTGFNNNLPGRANIYMAGHLMGLSKFEIDKIAEQIIEYSELDDYIDVPVKYYSNGMISRLGFAIATALDPEILLIDEVFSVGDLEFRKKSEKTLRGLLEKAQCQIIVTHNLGFVEEVCNRALYMRDGTICFDGEPATAVAQYKADEARDVPKTKFGSRFVVKE